MKLYIVTLERVFPGDHATMKDIFGVFQGKPEDVFELFGFARDVWMDPSTHGTKTSFTNKHVGGGNIVLREVEVKTLDPLTAEEWDCIRAGRKIGAIKLVRQRLGVSLKEALAYVDRHHG